MHVIGTTASLKEGETMWKQIKKAYPNLEAILEKNYMTARQIAGILGITYAKANRKRRGETKWTEEEMEKLSNFFQTDKEELFLRQ